MFVINNIYRDAKATKETFDTKIVSIKFTAFNILFICIPKR
jgi:hypothetical protein